MCDYCDCRDLTPIRELADDHDHITELAGKIRRALNSGRGREAAGEEAAAPWLAELQGFLATHLHREESGIFAQLAARPGFEWYLDQLTGDHSRARATLLNVDPTSAGWSAQVLAGLDDLAAHISLEEYDLFPASRMIIDDEGWAQVMEAHDRLRPGEPVEATGTR